MLEVEAAVEGDENMNGPDETRRRFGGGLLWLGRGGVEDSGVFRASKRRLRVVVIVAEAKIRRSGTIARFYRPER